MHDVFVLYNFPQNREAFDQHYREQHVPLVDAMPDVIEFTWGKAIPSDVQDSYYLVARMTFADAQTAAASLESPAGQAAVADLEHFAGAGVTVLQVPRLDDSRSAGDA